MTGITLIPIEKHARRGLSHLFRDYQWNYMPDAILDGYIGEAYVDDVEHPHIAVLEVLDLRLKLFGGDSTLPIAHRYIEQLSSGQWLFFGAPGWEALVRKHHCGRLVGFTRYAFTSEGLDFETLRELKSRLPEDYRLVKVDLETAKQLVDEKSEIAEDHFRAFESVEDFIARGFGYCILYEDEIVCLATTFLICDKGIEIQIDTRKSHRGKGLATVAGAQLVIHSIENNLDPNWDAANKISARLAKKLGYTPQGKYSIVFVVRSRMKAITAKVTLKLLEVFNR
jgi:GNAT superfamily N-acetyltransferase